MKGTVVNGDRHRAEDRVAVEEKQDTSEFERELQEHAPPSAPIRAIPLRLII